MKANEIIELYEKSMNINTAISNSISKISKLAKKYKIKILGDFPALEKKLLSMIDNMEKKDKKQKFEPNTLHDLIYSITIGEANNHQMKIFKEEYKKTLTALVSILKQMKKDNPWLDIKSIIEPIATLQIEVK